MNSIRLNVQEIEKIYNSFRTDDEIAVFEGDQYPSWYNKVFCKKDELAKHLNSGSGNWTYNAIIGWSNQDYDYGYIEGFFQIAHSAINLASVSPDTIIYPIIFNYRHYLELVLKTNLLRFQIFFREPINIPNNHDLCSSADDLYEILAKQNLTFLLNFEQLSAIEWFNKIDERNDRYRYVYDTSGRLNHPYDHNFVDLRKLHLLMNKIYNDFNALNLLFEVDSVFYDSMLESQNQALLVTVSNYFINKKLVNENQLRGYLATFSFVFDVIEKVNKRIKFKFEKDSIVNIDNRTFTFEGKTEYSKKLKFEIKTIDNKIASIRLTN